MKKLLYPIAFILTAFLILYSCSAEEEDTAPPPQVQQPTPEPEPEVSQFTLTVTAGEGGTVSTEGGTYDEGTEVSITATPAEGYEFVGWEGNDSNSDSLTITLNSNQSLSALFEQVQSNVIASSDGTTTDQDGNSFGWINYKSQDWAIENAQVVTYRDGTPIPQVNADAEEWGFLTTGAWCYYDNDPTKGKLYNWYAVMGIHDNDPNTPNKEFAPEGWHVPSKEDWEALREYLIRSHFNYDLSLCENRIAQSMASTIGWDNDINPIEAGYKGKPGYQQSLNNSSGFNALPTGYCDFDGFQGEFRDEGKRALFWSSSSNNPNNLVSGASSAELDNYSPEFFILGKTKMFGLSVRFMRD